LAKTKKESKFDAILLDAIDSAFTALGPNIKFSLYFNLHTKFSLPKEEIPGRIEDFTRAIETIFGQAAKQLEILIMKYLHAKIDCDYEWAGPKWLIPDLTFEKYIKLARIAIEGSGKPEKVEVFFHDFQRREQKT